MTTFSSLSAAVAAFDLEGGYLLSRWTFGTSTREVYDLVQHDVALAIGYEAEWLAGLPSGTNVPADALERARADARQTALEES
jgi:hypothetical protein